MKSNINATGLWLALTIPQNLEVFVQDAPRAFVRVGMERGFLSQGELARRSKRSDPNARETERRESSSPPTRRSSKAAKAVRDAFGLRIWMAGGALKNSAAADGAQSAGVYAAGRCPVSHRPRGQEIQ